MDRTQETDGSAESADQRQWSNRRALVARCWKQSQSLCGEIIWKRSDGTRFRALLERNAYDDQSSLKVYTWTSSEGWALVTRKPIEMCASKRWSYVSRGDEWHSDAYEDMWRIIDEAKEIVPYRLKGE